jgi:phosphate transport system permease protein
MNSEARSNAGGMASTGAVSRWTDGSMQAQVRKRYAAERRFRLFGLFAVGLSVAFLIFLLFTMAAKGLGGFTQGQIRLDVDFPKSDVMLDPASIKGPQAAEVVASAGLDGVLEQAAVAT